MSFALCVLAAVAFLVFLNRLSYDVLKRHIVASRRWGLNICCGNTDGGGINADIVPRSVTNFVEVNIFHLPFADDSIDSVLCSHTMEHVEDPDLFYEELCRVGKEVVIVLPPIWDLGAALNIFEHRWIFLCLRKKHRTLPVRIRLPLAEWWQRKFGQRINA